jgi:hypothetical protein
MKYIRPILLIILIVSIALYLGDTVVFYLRGNPTASVTVNQLIEVPLKGSKTEYDLTGPAAVTCARSLFPQSSWDPCWYVIRNQKKPIIY